MDAHTKTNRRHWDQLAALHPKTPFYHLDAFRRGENILDPIEREVLGEVRGKRLLQLQCHFGLETLSLARMGTDATGRDLSPVAIETARGLSNELDIPATFVEADVLHPPADLRGFDIVFASWGTLCWISDLDAWMRTFRELDRVAWPMPALVKAEEYYWKLPESLPYVPIGLGMTAERSD